SFAFCSTHFLINRSLERLSARLHRFGEAFFVEPFHSGGAVCGVVFPGVAKGGKSPWGYL
ncbi:MAG TPA: hypothetical protein VKP69_24130, partial [Isosphaeraceae bacterium]|nr:hypothetical protein [Isosphaeraceae bacterium]